MKITLIIYAISWVILLIMYIDHLMRDSNSKQLERIPWYFYPIIIVLAPSVFFMLPYFFVTDFRNKKKEKIANEEIGNRVKREKQRKKESIRHFKEACKKSNDPRASSPQNETGRQLLALGIESKYSNILDELKNIKLVNETTLTIEEAKKDGTGDISRLFIKNNHGKKDKNIFKHIIVEDNCDGAWQAFLLNSLWHVLPFWWHGNYYKRSYLFSHEDVKNIHFISKSISGLEEKLSKFELSPKIVKNKYNGKYYVSCCYWNDWEGLNRDLYEITIKDNKVTEFYKADSKNLYKYMCNILF